MIKRALIISTLAASALGLIFAQSYKMVIQKAGGETLEIPAEDIVKIGFEEEVPPTPPGGKLATPVLSVSKDGANVTVSWTEVANVKWYSWNLGGAAQMNSITSDTRYTFKNLDPGNYTFSITAQPQDGTDYKASDEASVDFTVAKSIVSGDRSQIITENYTHNSARVSYYPVSGSGLTAALIPAPAATGSAAINAAVNALPASERKNLTETTEVSYANLTPSTKYLAVITDGADNVVYREFTTDATPLPGTKYTIFPRGVSENAGFIDVDKYGDTEWGSDKALCWACVAASMIQWWLNDYEATEGSPAELKRPIPETSKYYATPVMDLISQAHIHDAWPLEHTLQWFFCGEPNPSKVYNGSQCAYNLSYEHVNGGWLGMPRDEFNNKFISYGTRVDLYGGGKTQAQVKEIFADKMLGWLRNGPVYFNISSGGHALLAWGAEYECDASGKRTITRLYISENDLVGGNLKNKLNIGTVKYTDYTGRTNYPYVEMSSIAGGGDASLGDIGMMVTLRSWDAVNGSK